MEDPRLLFDRARSALAAGDPGAAAIIAARLLSITPDQPQVLHLLAVAERRSGRPEVAAEYFRSALSADPANPEIHNNFANLLGEAGELERARLHYRRAVSLSPSYADALINLALLCRRLVAVDEGLAAAERAIAVSPSNARAWIALCSLREDAGDPEGAAAAADQAARLAPDDGRALSAQARIELRRGGNAVASYGRALAARPQDPELRLGHAASLHAAGRTAEAIAELQCLTSADPEWIGAHAMLAKLQLAAGAENRAVDSYRQALSIRPGYLPLWLAQAQLLAKLRDHRAVLKAVEDARLTAGDDPVLAGLEAVSLDELGDHERAGALLATLDAAAQPRSDLFALARTRNLIRLGRIDQAALRAEAATGRGVRALWPYLATAWRMIGDARWAWLEGDERFIGVSDSAQAADLIAELAPLLRELHTDQAPPLGQTLHGGTQTEGDLLFRKEPVITTLKQVLFAEVMAHAARLPEADDRHPLLAGSRNNLRFAGSWSVRLSDGGFHVNHVHPEGWISSAFYLVLPPRSSNDPDGAGWLTLGEPPSELNLGLAPFRTVEPKPGRLVLFPGFTWHGTRPFPAGERLTVAFDVAITA